MRHPWRQRYTADGDDFTKIEINIPREMRTYIDEMSGKLKLPPWRLICYAIDNERDLQVPFNFLIEEPTNKYVEHAYHEEATKIYNFLRKFRNGLGRDVLMLFRRHIGIENKITMMLALRECLQKEVIFETTERPKRGFELPENYKFLKAKDYGTADPKAVERQRKENEKLEKRLERNKRKLKIMEGTDGGSIGSETHDDSQTEK